MTGLRRSASSWGSTRLLDRPGSSGNSPMGWGRNQEYQMTYARAHATAKAPARMMPSPMSNSIASKMRRSEGVVNG